MELLATWEFPQPQGPVRRIELCLGDVTRLPPDEAVDILVVSAFPGDYTPTPGSLMGALHDVGISVAQLAHHKQQDMREEFGCWLSRQVPNDSFRRILCIESGWRGTPPEITDHLFRALAPLAISEFETNSVAMPIIGAGSQGCPVEVMLDAILRSAVSWFKRGLGVRTLKIFAFYQHAADVALAKFREMQEEFVEGKLKTGSFRAPVISTEDGNISFAPQPPALPSGYDVFLSYAHEDADIVQDFLKSLQDLAPNLRIFCDRRSIQPGVSWMMEIAESLDNAKRVVAFYTPHYWASEYCKEEFAAALTRQRDTGQDVLYPIYYREARIPYFFRNLQVADCREADAAKLLEACNLLHSAMGK